MKARMMSTRKVAARMISVFSSRPRLPNDALKGPFINKVKIEDYPEKNFFPQRRS